MKGDNLPVSDPELVSSTQIISIAVKLNNNPLIIPKVGYITLWARGL
jgi:signal peptidase I